MNSNEKRLHKALGRLIEASPKGCIPRDLCEAISHAGKVYKETAPKPLFNEPLHYDESENAVYCNGLIVCATVDGATLKKHWHIIGPWIVKALNRYGEEHGWPVEEE